MNLLNLVFLPLVLHNYCVHHCEWRRYSVFAVPFASDEHLLTMPPRLFPSKCAKQSPPNPSISYFYWEPTQNILPDNYECPMLGLPLGPAMVSKING